MATIAASARPAASSPAAQAYQILHIGFTVAPILAGLDKFLGLLTNWDQYLAPAIAGALPFSGHTFMLIVGAIEIVAGIGVFLMPRVFAYVVSAWLVGIILNLLLAASFLDVALRDLGLALGALALGRLSQDPTVER
jgi:hypothetical protein